MSTQPFAQFTNRYSLSKTLRFELKPVGKTLDNMRKHLRWNKDLQTFLADQEIEDAYQILKPHIDKLHEAFITDALESEEARCIPFSGYFEEYKNKKEREETALIKIENQLREKIGELYDFTGEQWKRQKYPQFEWKKGSQSAKSFEILSSQDVLRLIKDSPNTDDTGKDAASKILEEKFFTYFGGFNQNRENYYATKAEKATAIATRIIHENLPKFCDNIIFFENRKGEYLSVYDFLKQKGNTLITKENKPFAPITSELFIIKYFNDCLSQKQIETYNEKIGNANSLINLYNQAKQKEEEVKRLPLFKTLYKQIGFGNKDPLFFQLTHDTKARAQENKEKYKKPYSVEQILEQAVLAGKTYFQNIDHKDAIATIPDLLTYLLQKQPHNYEGLYWSKAAINTISNKYFADWSFLKEQLKNEKTVASYNEKREEQIKINDTVELASLFTVLKQIENWREIGVLFKESLTKSLPENSENQEENKRIEQRINILSQSVDPGSALFAMIVTDIRSHMDQFIASAETVLQLPNYHDEQSKEQIKQWLDHALSVMQMLKYFLVNENKVKGASLDSVLVNTLKTFLFESKIIIDTERIAVDWFKWYDAVRNYLTKKPQDDAKENKLKLNFENGSLLGGWSDGQEKVKASVILRKDNEYYLGILKVRGIFNTEKVDNPIYKNTTINTGRLILANLKFQTLAGKGFLGKFGQSYGDMGKNNPLKAVENLQKIIADRYITKYPLLKKVVEKSYENKKDFDKEIQEILVNCYVCEFTRINWEEVDKQTQAGNMYLFKIHTKDNGGKAIGNKDLQTLYWQTVFEDDSPIQLNGGGEIFYRKMAIEDKKIKNGYESKPYVIENKRYTVEKFLFHCPIKLNYKSKMYSKPEYALAEINQQTNDIFIAFDDIYFLGIDRGEKHLAYYCLVDKNGKIVEQDTFNVINGCNYHAKLDELEKNRQEARKNWKTIETIKELKEGYISHVVHKIAYLAVTHNAFIVLEDLSTDFKRIRRKIEKSVYQKFELALAKKLNFLVDKTTTNGEVGSVTKALQLTPPVRNYQDIENHKQVGIMLYTRANYTSQTDPVTGWRKTIRLKKGSEENIKEQILNSFTDFGFDGQDYYFTYKDKNIDKEWRLYSGKNGKSLDRFRGKKDDKNVWNIEQIDVKEKLDKLFKNFDKSSSYHSQIVDGNVLLVKINEKHTAWESLRFVIDVIQQIRNTGKNARDNDFLQSPVRDRSGNHFDSRIYWDQGQKGKKNNLPGSGDANGAHNIARKGILMHEHIRTWIATGKPKYDSKTTDLNLFISDKEWDIYLADKEAWKKQLLSFASRKAMEEQKK